MKSTKPSTKRSKVRQARKPRQAGQSPKFLAINLALYRLHVIVTWETTGAEIAEFARQHGCRVSDRFVPDFNEQASDALGLCMAFHNDYPDVLVWLSKKPTKASSYATLYHELYHAIDSVSKSRNLADEPEARAYAFEYLVNECNRFFWPR